MNIWSDIYKTIIPDNPNTYFFDDTITLYKGYEFLEDCKTIEDWGCGGGAFKKLFLNNNKQIYIGVDNCDTPCADIKMDLIFYRSNPEGIFIRHVLEYNYDWDKILKNACKSFKKKLCLIISTPYNETKEIENPKIKKLKTIMLNYHEIIFYINKYNCKFDCESFHTNTPYGIEHIFYIRKKYNLAYYSGFMGLDQNKSFEIPPLPSESANCYFFTNNPEIFEKIQQTKWIPVLLDNEFSEDKNISNLQYEHLKICPHSYKQLSNYEYTIWVDNHLGKIHDDKVFNLVKNMNNNDILLKKHPFLNGYIWYELDYILKIPEFKNNLPRLYEYIFKQTVGKGLEIETKYHVTTEIIIRKMNENSRSIGEDWYNDIKDDLKFGILNYFSFFFIKQKYAGIQPFEENYIKVKK